MDWIKETIKEIKLYDVHKELIRLGPHYDGGYVVIKDIVESTPFLVSCGFGGDASFEQDFLDFAFNEVAVYEINTNEKLPANLRKHPRIDLHYIEVGKELPIIPDKQTMLKMDIEGSEWDYFRREHNYNLRKFNQIIVEFHFLHVGPPEKVLTKYFYSVYSVVAERINNSCFEKYCKVLQKINNDFYCFHIHPNNSVKPMRINGYITPPLVEMSFVRKDLVEEAEVIGSNGMFPTLPITGLDFPNKTDRLDFRMEIIDET